MKANKANTIKVIKYINNLEYTDLLKLQGIIENKVELEQLSISLMMMKLPSGEDK